MITNATVNLPVGIVSSEGLIEILWERGVPPTVVAEQMAFLSECRDADNLRAEMVRKMKAEAGVFGNSRARVRLGEVVGVLGRAVEAVALVLVEVVLLVAALVLLVVEVLTAAARATSRAWHLFRARTCRTASQS